MRADYHLHTAFSDDSEYPMEQVVQDAIAMGLSELCFTDHVDYGIKRDWDDAAGMQYRAGGPGEPPQMPLANVDYPLYFDTIARLQQRYAGRIRLRAGLEFGMQLHTIPQYRALFARWPLDFVILSVHQVEDREFWNQAFQQGRTQQQYNQRYYQEMLGLVTQYKDYSVLGHMDLITRYDQQGPYPFAQVRDIVAEILRTVIADGKGIEVNTSSRRYGLADSTPAREILALYRDLGGRVVTIGSDSHKPAHLGAGIREAQQLLAGLGFGHFCTYTNMQPQFHPLAP